MKQRLDPSYKVILNQDVFPELDAPNSLVLKSKRQVFKADFHFPLVMKEKYLSLAPESSEMDQLLFYKFTRQLVLLNYAHIELFPGLILESCEKHIFDEFMIHQSQSPLVSLSPGVVVESLNSLTRLTDTVNHTVVTMMPSLFFDVLAGKENDVSLILVGLKIFNNQRPVDDDLASSFFHFHTTKPVSVINTENYKLLHKWKGEPEVCHFEGEFHRVLSERRSSYLKVKSPPSIEEVSRMLRSVYGTTKKNGELKFFYPSPGAGYSIKLMIVCPDSDQEILYEFDPIKFQLSEKEKAPLFLTEDGWIRIYLVGDLTELKKKYAIIPYRLLLLEAGVIFNQISLAVSYHKLQGRIIGHTSEKVVKNNFKDSFNHQELVLGEFILTKKSEA